MNGRLTPIIKSNNKRMFALIQNLQKINILLQNERKMEYEFSTSCC